VEDKKVGQASCLTRQTGILLSRRSLAKAEPVIQRPKSFHAINNTKILAIGGNNSPSISRRDAEKQSFLTEKFTSSLLPPRLCASARNNSFSEPRRDQPEMLQQSGHSNYLIQDRS
jgi:hypothetical protein